MNILRFLNRVFGPPEPTKVLHVGDRQFWCALCFAVSVRPGLPLPDDNDAVTVIDGNASCQEHLMLLEGRTVTKAIEALKRELAEEGGPSL